MMPLFVIGSALLSNDSSVLQLRSCTVLAVGDFCDYNHDNHEYSDDDLQCCKSLRR